jgi:cytidine deaminase
MPITQEIKLTLDVYQNKAELLPEEQICLEKALQIAQKAYAPYSNFQVGAVLLLENGEMIAGNNQENAAYPSGLCAERTALFYYGANYAQHKIKLLIIVAHKAGSENLVVATPCGGCRQVMLEYEDKQHEAIPVIVKGEGDSWVKIRSVADLLPLKFSKDQL